MKARPNTTLILIGHGSTTNPDSAEPTHLHADRIRAQKIFDEVRCAFWKEEPSLREVLYGITSREVYIVPNFISEGYFTQKVIPRELELTGRITLRDNRPLSKLASGDEVPGASSAQPRSVYAILDEASTGTTTQCTSEVEFRKGSNQKIYYTDPVGSHPSMTGVILKRARETAPGIDPEETTLFIVGHGTNLNDNSAKAAKDQVERIKNMNLYGEVLSAYMEEPPLINDWSEMATKPNVVVVPFFISDGLHSYQDIPVLLGIEKTIGPAASQAEVFRRNPYHLHGKTLYYASSIGTEPMMTEVILDQVAAFDAA